jgi:Fe-S-cluster containining protein
MRAKRQPAAGGYGRIPPEGPSVHDAIARCADDVATIADDLLGTFLPSEGAFAILMELVEERIGAALAARESAPPACGPGCAACCTVNVGTLAVEGAAIAAWLRSRLGPEGAPGAARALLDFHERVRWLDDGERIRERLACPFLDAARACTIHPVRPLACRSITSLDPAECRRAVEERSGDDPGLVRMDLVQRAVYGEAVGRLAGAMEARGLDGRLRDVTGMAGAFLADPGLARSFGEGARVPLD